MKNNFTLLVILFVIGSLTAQEIDVTFPSENLTLNGTLALPIGEGPFSVVVLVHGSGPNDRDQTLELTGGNAACLYPGLLGDTIRNFKGISDSLVTYGYAVFRYEKRSFSHGTQLDPKTVTTSDFIIDIHNAIDYLKTRSEIDTTCISLLGHSQGASFVPVVANQRNDIKSVICLGTPASRIDTILAEQFRDLYIKCLNDSVTGNAYYAQTVLDFSEIRNGTWSVNTPYLGAYPLFWNDWMTIGEHAISDFNALRQPFIIIHGADDFNVSLADFNRLQTEISHANGNFVLLNGINHYMTTANDPIIAQSVVSELVGFLQTNSCSLVHVSAIEKKNSIAVFQESGRLKLTSESHWEGVYLYGLDGKMHYQFNGNSNQLHIQTQGLKSGIYFLRVDNVDERQVIKVFVK